MTIIFRVKSHEAYIIKILAELTFDLDGAGYLSGFLWLCGWGCLHSKQIGSAAMSHWRGGFCGFRILLFWRFP